MGDTRKSNSEQIACYIQQSMPAEGLFDGYQWRVATKPFELDKKLVKQLEKLGRILLKFYKATNMIYRWSTEDRLPKWPAEWLERGKPKSLIDLQRHRAFKNELPRVIRPDILLTEEGLKITELDSVPGGIGLTAWLNRSYSDAGSNVIGGPNGMIDGFSGIFGNAEKIRMIVSDESATYRPEMKWIAEQIGGDRCSVHDQNYMNFNEGDAVYRFFELFDLENIPAAETIFQLATEQKIKITAPPKTFLEEKMTFGLFHNRNLSDVWRQQLGDNFKNTLETLLPQTWIVDPEPIPPQAAYPGINLTDWNQLKDLSQKERNLILKISGFSDQAWGARGVWLGSDLPREEWTEAVVQAIAGYKESPRILQRYHHPIQTDFEWFNFENRKPQPMQGRVRLCPYYFVHGEWDSAQTTLGGVLATICPSDKKIIHGMSDAILAPCALKQT